MTDSTPSRHPARVLLVAATLALLSSTSRADNPSLRDGLPCVRQVCVGDDLVALLGIAWAPVGKPARPAVSGAIASSLLRTLQTYLRADEATLERITPYWLQRRFDAPGLSALARVTAVCQDFGVWMRPQATYVNDRGHTTTVAFEPIPTTDAQPPRFQVATVTRVYPPDTPAQELARIGNEIAARYADLPMYPSEAQAAVQWLPHAHPGPTLRLFAPIGDSAQRSFELSRHPSCQQR